MTLYLLAIVSLASANASNVPLLPIHVYIPSSSALTSLMVPGGRLLLAGLLVDQAEAVIEAYAPDVALSIADQQEEWVLLAGEKR